MQYGEKDIHKNTHTSLLHTDTDPPLRSSLHTLAQIHTHKKHRRPEIFAPSITRVLSHRTADDMHRGTRKTNTRIGRMSYRTAWCAPESVALWRPRRVANAPPATRSRWCPDRGRPDCTIRCWRCACRERWIDCTMQTQLTMCISTNMISNILLNSV